MRIWNLISNPHLPDIWYKGLLKAARLRGTPGERQRSCRQHQFPELPRIQQRERIQMRQRGTAQGNSLCRLQNSTQVPTWVKNTFSLYLHLLRLGFCNRSHRQMIGLSNYVTWFKCLFRSWPAGIFLGLLGALLVLPWRSVCRTEKVLWFLVWVVEW